jgi:hypothetical protein
MSDKRSQRERDRDAKDLRRRQGHPLNDNLGARQPRVPAKGKKK